LETPPRPKILCVDDERLVREGLTLHLRRRYEVATAESGAEALLALRRDPGVAVIVSDMRMPAMDGAAFLAESRTVAPDAVRLLLTGMTDTESAVKAVNEGQIFRFLTKPCPPATLMLAVEAAVEQHRLVTAERVLLEQTLHGAIRALTDVLALSNPISFGRATRIKDLVSSLADKLALTPRWQLEVAAMLSQLWTITLPPDTIEKLHFGQNLTPEEHKMVERAPIVTDQLVRNIPRLERVAEILAAESHHRARRDLVEGNPGLARIDLEAQVLRAAVDFDALDTQGSPASVSVETMRGRATRYGPAVLDALGELRGGQGPRAGIREIYLSVLCAGMVFVDDVKSRTGTLLVARGFEVTPSFLERVRNLPPGTVKEPLRVILKLAPPPGRA
jgi:response regulator RpfG family c-di-GMP phosphodiesterase